jgi:hypothetical protein
MDGVVGLADGRMSAMNGKDQGSRIERITQRDLILIPDP